MSQASVIAICKPKTEEELTGVANVSFTVDDETMSRFWTEDALRAFRRCGRREAAEAAHRFSENILAAKDGDAVVGMIVYCPAYENFEGEPLIPQSTLINNVYVLPQYRGRGIGRQLLDAVFTCMIPQYTAAVLYVYEENHPAKDFYLRCGFRFDGVSFSDGVIYKGRFERMVRPLLSAP